MSIPHIQEFGWSVVDVLSLSIENIRRGGVDLTGKSKTVGVSEQTKYANYVNLYLPGPVKQNVIPTERQRNMISLIHMGSYMYLCINLHYDATNLTRHHTTGTILFFFLYNYYNNFA